MFRNIVYHWTAGGYYPNGTDLEHYHFVVDVNGKVLRGKFVPSDNLNCSDGKYAAHTGGGNTGRIGIAVCCRKDVNTPPTQKQIEAMCELGAKMCITYGLSPKQCITHAEFGITHPKTSSYGKIDINYLPHIGLRGIKECAEYLRNKTEWYYQKLKGK